MSESNHTPEPWHFNEREYGKAIMGPFDVDVKPGRPKRRKVLIAQFASYTDEETNPEANARRAISCVNACAGMTAPVAEVAALRRCAELLRTTCKCLESNNGWTGVVREIKPALAALTAAQNGVKK